MRRCWFASQGDFSTTTHFCTNQNPIVEMKNRTKKNLKLYNAIPERVYSPGEPTVLQFNLEAIFSLIIDCTRMSKECDLFLTSIEVRPVI